MLREVGPQAYILPSDASVTFDSTTVLRGGRGAAVMRRIQKAASFAQHRVCHSQSFGTTRKTREGDEQGNVLIVVY